MFDDKPSRSCAKGSIVEVSRTLEFAHHRARSRDASNARAAMTPHAGGFRSTSFHWGCVAWVALTCRPRRRRCVEQIRFFLPVFLKRHRAEALTRCRLSTNRRFQMFSLKSCLINGSTRPPIALSYGSDKRQWRRVVCVTTAFERRPHGSERR